MTEFIGISHGGRSAEDEFVRATGATRATVASIGDVLLEGHPVEVKKASSNTLNQVRAVKYIPLAALDTRTNVWYVIPAHVIVREVARKRRGQHTENPFESATLSLGNLSRYRIDSEYELASATLRAIEDSARYLDLKREMDRVLGRSRSLAEESVDRVRILLQDLGLSG